MKKAFKAIKTIRNTLIAVLTITVLLLSGGCKGEQINITDSDAPPPQTTATTTPASDAITSEPDSQALPISQTSQSTEFDPNVSEPNPDFQTEPIVTGTDEPNNDSDGGETLAPAEPSQIADTATSLLGVPFADGGSSPSEGFDNSGFIYYVLRQNGYVNCPRGLQEQAVMGNPVNSVSELHSGDLVFFAENSDKPQFGGIYIGDGVMISCRMPGEDVREFNISSGYYYDNFLMGVRVL